MLGLHLSSGCFDCCNASILAAFCGYVLDHVEKGTDHGLVLRRKRMAEPRSDAFAAEECDWRKLISTTSAN
jgi:hypothetical protein